VFVGRGMVPGAKRHSFQGTGWCSVVSSASPCSMQADPIFQGSVQRSWLIAVVKSSS
jgi:hypothetical protein